VSLGITTLLFFSNVLFKRSVPEIFLQSGFGQIIEGDQEPALLTQTTEVVPSSSDSSPDVPEPARGSLFLAALRTRADDWRTNFQDWLSQKLSFLRPRKKLTFDKQAVPLQTIVSQDLYALAKKSRDVKALASSGQGSEESLAQIMAEEPVFTSTVFNEANHWEITTDETGQIRAQLPKGVYLLKVLPLPPYDFTNLPEKVVLANQAVSILLGLNVGSGQVFLRRGDFVSDPQLATANGIPSENNQHLVVTLFSDQNNNQQLDDGEKIVPWAGVTLILEKQEGQGFGQLVR
jgi:hypothetical protein